MPFRFYIDERALIRARFTGNELRSPFATLGRDGRWHESDDLTPSPYHAGVVTREVAAAEAVRIVGHEVNLDAVVTRIGSNHDGDICAGIDIGGKRKGFHGAAISGRAVVEPPRHLPDVAAAVEWLQTFKPAVVALDSPNTCATEGERSRAGERELAREICGIRWTPDRPALDGVPYFGWVLHGFELYEAIAEQLPGVPVIEVFPTASWTVWHGERGAKRRAAWSREALASLDLAHKPKGRTNQDERDAIAAALTAQLYVNGRTRSFGDIEVPDKRKG